MKRQLNLRLLIFSLIGIFNTLFDLALYVVVYRATESVVIANIVSTSAALVGSYALNARLTFRGSHWTPRRFVMFIGVTLFGLWVLQTIIILALNPVANGLPVGLFGWLGGAADTARTLLPKLAATAVTFVWNYVWYEKVVFKNKNEAARAMAVETL